MPSMRSVSQQSSTSMAARAVPSHRQLLKIDQRLSLVDATDEDSLELNVQFQALIEVVLSIYVNSWYSRLTPRDRSFIPNINIITFAFSRSLLSTVQAEDVTTFLLVRFPTILAHHTRLFNLASDQVNTSLVTSGGTDETPERRLARSYHALASHLGVIELPNGVIPDIEQNAAHPLFAISPLYLTVFTEQLLFAHLPAADSKSDLERLMIREILANAVLGGTFRRLTEPWFWWKVGLAVLGEPGKMKEKPGKSHVDANGINQFSVRALLHGSLVMVNSVSSLLLNLTSAARLVATSFKAAQPTERSYRHILDPWMSLAGELLKIDYKSRTSAVVWGMLRDTCQIGGPIFERTLPRLVQTHILSPRVISRSIEKLTDILFPNGQPAPDSPDPTAEESADLRQRLERRLLEVMPTVAQYGLLGSTDTEQATTVHDMLSPLANRDINVHLAIVLLDSLVALTETNV